MEIKIEVENLSPERRAAFLQISGVESIIELPEEQPPEDEDLELRCLSL